MAFFGICFMGAGELVGGLGMGPLRDKIGTKMAFGVEILLLIATFTLIIWFN